MLEFLAAGWLAALGALALPLLLHLLGAGQERRVRVGSVRFLRPAATRRGRRFRPSELLLLLLRCALLAALAVALAAPRWRAGSQEDSAAPWVLVDPRLLVVEGPFTAQAPLLAKRLGELRREGAVVRALAPGLPRRVAAGTPVDPVPDLWSLVREADLLAPAGAPLHLLVSDRAASLRGRRPALGRRFEVLAAPEPGENLWIERARRRLDGSVRLVVGRSAAAGTSFETLSLAAAGAGGAPAGVAVERAGEEWVVRLLKGGDDPSDDEVRLGEPQTAETAFVGLRQAPQRAVEATRLRAGLEAAAQTGGLDVAIVAAAADAPRKGGLGILFLLGLEPSAAERAWLHAGGWLVVERSSPDTECEAQADLPLGPRGVPLRLRRCRAEGAEEAPGAPAVGPGSAPLAVDGAGRTLLAGRRVGRGLELALDLGLSPAVSELTLHPAFPAGLAALLEARWPAATAARAASDRRSAGIATIGPEPASLAPGAAPRSSTPESLAWVLVALLFAGERCMGWLSRQEEA